MRFEWHWEKDESRQLDVGFIADSEAALHDMMRFAGAALLKLAGEEIPTVSPPAPEFTPEEVNEEEEGFDPFKGMEKPEPKPLPASYLAGKEAEAKEAERRAEAPLEPEAS